MGRDVERGDLVRIIQHGIGMNVRLLVTDLQPEDLPTLLTDFADATRRAPREFDTWQAAWNAYTGAEQRGWGSVTFTPMQCQTCNGKRVDFRHGRLCPACGGTGRGRHPVQHHARAAHVPLSQGDAHR